jgi:hypothetical protein
MNTKTILTIGSCFSLAGLSPLRRSCLANGSAGAKNRRQEELPV